MKWKEKKEISLLSTGHSLQKGDGGEKAKSDEEPQAIVDYNDTMGSVNRVDQHFADYATPIKHRNKYYKKIFFHLLDLILWNFYIFTDKWEEQNIMWIFVSVLSHSPRVGRQSSTPNPLRLSGHHISECLPQQKIK